MFNKKNKFSRLLLVSVFLILGAMFLFNLSSVALASDTFGTNVVSNSIELGDKDPRSIATQIINILMSILGVIAVAIVIYAGFMWMTSEGQEEKIEKAKKILKAGVIGLVIILASWGIVTFVLSRLGNATGTTGNITCTDGDTTGCGCDGIKVCNGGSWGSCVGSTCLPGSEGSYCNNSSILGVCSPDNTQCNSGLVCGDSCRCAWPGQGAPCGDNSSGTCSPNNDDCSNPNLTCSPTSCTCLPNNDDDNGYAELGEACNNGGSCSATEDICNPNHGLSCDASSCTCKGNPVITAVSPVGGFCDNNINVFCEKDTDCPGSTCDKTTPNAAKGNFITILGYNFDTYSSNGSNVWFVKGGENYSPEIRIRSQQPSDFNSNCQNTWTNNRIIAAIATSTLSSINMLTGDNFRVEVHTKDFKIDSSDDEVGPKIKDLKINEISRPGLCGLSSNEGNSNSDVYYYGTGLNNSQVYFGNLFSSSLAFIPNTLNSDTSGMAKVPNINNGDTSTFVKRSSVNSNILDFTKLADAPVGPSISSFGPDKGSAGQYVTILGDNFGKYKGNNSIYFRLNSADTEASFDFPAVCVDSLWSNNQILVKVPAGLANGDYSLVLKISSWPDVISINTFKVDSALPLTPSLCKISPSFGPQNTMVSLWGEYFGTNCKAIFNNNKASIETVNEPENGADKIKVRVPSEAITGPVKVSRAGVTGNSVNFSVGSCTKSADCSSEAPTCCLVGSPQAGACVINEGDCFVDTALSSVFQWGFVTGFNNFDPVDPNNPPTSCAGFNFCPEGYVCPNSPGLCSNNSESSSCDCCCDKNQNEGTNGPNPACCAPLTCDNKCGVSANPGATVTNLGLCSGCNIAGATTAVKDSACNCVGTSGKYCDTDSSYPTGACLDCSALSAASCKEHSATCCYDAKEDKCRGGVSDSSVWGATSANIGFCPYYNCNASDPTVCAPSIPTTNGAYKNIYTCDTECKANCSAITNANTCKDKGRCCWNEALGTCSGGEKYSTDTSNASYGLCAFYNCTTPGSSCLKSTTTTTYTDSNTCNTACRNQPAGAGTACYDAEEKLCTTDFCNKFACLNNEGDSLTEGTIESCGVCCCSPTNDKCKANVGENLTCVADQGNCTGSSRGLCCGCSSDDDCTIGNLLPEEIGCGIDTCCQARPSIKINKDNIGWLDVKPEPYKNNVCRNGIIEINFDKRMDVLSLEGNVLLLQELASGSECPNGTQKIAGLSRDDIGDSYQQGFFATVKNIWKKSWSQVAKIFGKDTMAADGDLVYCSIMGTFEVDHSNLDNTSIYFKPVQLLQASSKYYVVVKGDEELNSQSGVKSFAGVAMNGKGFYGGTDTNYNSLDWKESDDGLFELSGKFYKNSYIWSFSTLSSNTPGQGICTIEYLEVSPDSYLFQDNKNDIKESDADARHSTFDSSRDKDKAYYVKAKTADNQIIGPSNGYSWFYDWSINNTNVIEFNNDVVNWTATSSNRLVQVKAGVLEGKSDVIATVKMDNGNIINSGNGKSRAVEAWVLVCKNPWPAFKSNGTWTPWVDTSSFNSYNYEFYYCRDAGVEGTIDDLPAFMTNSAIIKGNSLFKVCSNNPNITCSTNSDCPGNALCIVSFLKETYLFRNARSRVISSFEALDNGSGSSINLSWVSGVEGVNRFLVYFNPTGSSATPNSVSVPTSACQLVNLNTQYSCSYVLNGLNSDQSYNVRVVALNSSSLELGSSFYTSVMPIFVPMVNPFTAVDTTLGRELNLSWQSSITNVNSYRLSYRAEGATTDTLVDIPLSGNCEKVADKYYCNYKLKNLFDDKSYTLKITALKSGGGEIGSSRVVSAKPTYVHIPFFSNVNAVDTTIGGQVGVAWKSLIGDITGYRVYYKLNTVTNWTYTSLGVSSCSLSNNVYSCSYNVGNLTNNNLYNFKIVSVKNSSEIDTSDIVNATPTFIPFVSNFSAVDAGTGGRINLSWQSPKTNVTGYYLANGVGGSTNHPASLCQSSGNNYVCSGVIAGLTNGQTYNVKINAYNSSLQTIGSSNPISVVPTIPFSCPPTLSYNGYTYPVIRLKDQCWFAENLRATAINDGTFINNAVDNNEWSDSFDGKKMAYSWYNNDSSANVSFGILYNKIAVDSGKLCPSGWHVPTGSDVDKMIDNLKSNNTYWCGGTSTNIAKSVASVDRWSTSSYSCYPGYDVNTNNSSKFNALPGGRRSKNGDFSFIRNYAYFWKTNGMFYIGNSSAGLEKIEGINDGAGFSVRCVMD